MEKRCEQPREGRGLRKLASHAGYRDSCTPFTSGPAVGGGLGSMWIHKGRRPPPLPPPAGQARSDLGPVCLSSPSPHPLPGLRTWEQPATSWTPAPGQADPQAGGGHLSPSRAPAKALQQPRLLSDWPRVGQVGREGCSEQEKRDGLRPPGRPCCPVLLGSRATQQLGAPRFCHKGPCSACPLGCPGSHSGIQPRPGLGAETVLLSKGRATSCLSLSTSARLVTLKRASWS